MLDEPATILFVDDDPILREFADVHLSSDMAKLVAAPDGVVALDLLASRPFDLVLADLEMPRMDGFELLERLRADPRWRDLPVIVETGREDVAAIDRAFHLGATSFVVKPLNWRLLSYQIRFVLRAARAEAARSGSVAPPMLQASA
ncbi:MAG TPA: response regulator [Caulobacteraceae bacterium]|nr:response regulator [Caulobacteraceae bacterium]